MLPPNHSYFCAEADPTELANQRQLGSPGHLFFSQCPKNAYLAKNIRNCNSYEKLLMLNNSGHQSFDQMGELLFLTMSVHINKSSMVDILSFSEVANIVGVHIKMDTSKGKSSKSTCKTGAFFILEHLWRVCFTQTLMTLLWSLILLIPLLTPTLFYPPWNKTMNFHWFWSWRSEEISIIAATFLLASNNQL